MLLRAEELEGPWGPRGVLGTLRIRCGPSGLALAPVGPGTAEGVLGEERKEGGE